MHRIIKKAKWLDYLTLISLFSIFIFPQYAFLEGLSVDQSILAQDIGIFEFDLENQPFLEYVAQIEGQVDDVALSPTIQGISFIQSAPSISLFNSQLNQSTAGWDTDLVREKRYVIITAYSSTPDQTDSTPFITASGTHVRDGIIACNFLEFGTKVKFPHLFGDKIFIVEDRMAPKNSHKIDIWFPSRSQALEFGIKLTEVLIL